MLNMIFLWSWGHHAEQNLQVVTYRTGVVLLPQPLALLGQEGTKQSDAVGPGQGLGGAEASPEAGRSGSVRNRAH